jgi:hypothetical protein
MKTRSRERMQHALSKFRRSSRSLNRFFSKDGLIDGPLRRRCHQGGRHGHGEPGGEECVPRDRLHSGQAAPGARRRGLPRPQRRQL